MNRRSPFRAGLLGLALALALPAAAADAPATTAAEPAPDAALQAAIAGPWRDPANVARDRYRHPGQTLAFFGIRPDMTVVEITPGGGWYSEILAPYLREQGRYVAAVVDPQAVAEGPGRDYQQRARDGLEKKFAAAPEQYDRASFVAFDPKAPVFGPPGSADLVLTFRNVHNWRMAAGRPRACSRASSRCSGPAGCWVWSSTAPPPTCRPTTAAATWARPR